MNRRQFLNTLSAPIILGSVSIKPSSVAPPPVRNLCSYRLLEPGYYTCKVIGVDSFQSVATGKPLFKLILETEQLDRVAALCSPNAPQHALALLNKFKPVPAMGVIELSDYVGTEARVWVGRQTYENRTTNCVRVTS